mmetsp:Transcript_15513/g.27564  ORF Transcript_15513/g.27564 Transcript_15513/m.27564 type:complete len:565 (-) Transcript_15513:502-2196(-)
MPAGLTDVSEAMVLVCMAPLGLVCFVSWWLNLGLVSKVAIGSGRTFLQLTVLGYVLKPIFDEGRDHPWVVLLYLTFMMSLTARESSSRPKYSFKWQTAWLFLWVCVNVGLVSLLAFGVVIRPKNKLDPQYVIPMCGMIFGNIINAISLSLNALVTKLVEERAEPELLLSFGATKFEACSRLIRDAIRTGTMPTFNNMAVIGLISIPGMMTGQVLGGNPPDVAARYQMMIMYLIATASFGTVLGLFWIVMRIAFNDANQFCPHRFFLTKGKVPKSYREQASSFWKSACCCLYCWVKKDDPHSSNTTTSPLLEEHEEQENGTCSIKIEPINTPHVAGSGSERGVFKAHGLSRTVVSKDDSYDVRRVLFQNIQFSFTKGTIVFVSGPSGCGKSQLLRLLANLDPREAGNVYLNGEAQNESPDGCKWRHRVRYVTQYKVEMPGSPRDYLERIIELNTFKASKHSLGLQDITSGVEKLILEWGMNRYDLDKNWKELSGGEAQRMVLAAAVASQPEVLLMDESTSALDLASKVSVEKSMLRIAKEQSMVIFWISHDGEQISRLKAATQEP